MKNGNSNGRTQHLFWQVYSLILVGFGFITPSAVLQAKTWRDQHRLGHIHGADRGSTRCSQEHI